MKSLKVVEMADKMADKAKEALGEGLFEEAENYASHAEERYKGLGKEVKDEQENIIISQKDAIEFARSRIQEIGDLRIKIIEEEKIQAEQAKAANEIIYGWRNISSALNIKNKIKKRNKKPFNITGSDKKKFFRMAKKYDFPIHYTRDRHIYMLKNDIDMINNYYLLGIKSIAEYFGIHIKTLRKWLKRFPRMPVDRKRGIAYIPELNYWYSILLFNRKKGGKSTARLFRPNARYWVKIPIFRDDPEGPA